ncbi:MAG: glycosyltransferase family 2 protein [Acidobacteriota bacterium]
MALPKISVILPVRNEVHSLGRLLDQMLQQAYPAESFEILVADGRSTDGTRAVVEQKAQSASVSLRVIDNTGIRSGAGRNAGVSAATGDIILFIDGHCQIPSTQLLRDTVLLLEETGADCLCRPQPLIAYNPRGVGRIIADARASALGHGRDSLIYNMSHSGFVHPASSGATYRRPVFARVGLYDESFDACEDVEFNTRVAAAGYKAYTDPRLSVYYEPRKSFRGLFRQMMRYGIGRVRLARKHPESASLSQWAPAVLVAAFAVALLSAATAMATGHWLLAVLAFPAAMFVLITIAASMHLGWRHGPAHALLGPIAYGCIYLGLGSGMWAELLRPAPREKTARTAVNFSS